MKRRRTLPADLPATSQPDNETLPSTTGEVLTSTPLSDFTLSDPALFSDENGPISSPPSSPPGFPWDKESLPTDNPVQKAKAFARLDCQPLQSIDDYARSRDDKPPMQLLKPRKPLIQMQINLGQSFQKQCKTCGMEYIPSNTEDASLHRKFHAQNVGGVDLDKAFVKKMEESTYVHWRGNSGDLIIMLERGGTTIPAMRRTQTVLDVVRSELGAVEITHDMLYSGCYIELPFPGPQDQREVMGQSGNGPQYNRYKVYLYLRGAKCVGACLAERINKAYKVVDPDQQETAVEAAGVTERGKQVSQHILEWSTDKPICISNVADPAWLGISRIWTSSSARRGGVATTLLEVTRKTFRRGVFTPQDLMAFSQPTESGARLARNWFGKQYGWHVYTD